MPLADDQGALTDDGADTVLERSERAGALILGPGLGRAPSAFALARRVAAEAAIPLLLDADGLNAHEELLGSLSERPAPTVLTPHAGELARLLATESSAVAARRLHSACQAAALQHHDVHPDGDQLQLRQWTCSHDR